MPPEVITREELMTSMKIMEKHTEQMTLVSQTLIRIAENQEKTNGRLYNGLSKEIQEGVVNSLIGSVGPIEKNQNTLLSKLESVKADTFWIKVTFGVIGTAIVIALALQQIVHLIGSSGSVK